MKFLLATKHMQWSEEAEHVQKNSDHIQFQAARSRTVVTPQPGIQVAVLSKTTKYILPKLWRMQTVQNADIFMRLRSYGNSEKTCGSNDD